MTEASIRLKATGRVTPADLRDIAGAFDRLLAALTEEAGGDVGRDVWFIHRLNAGSADLIAKGDAGGNSASADAIGGVASRFGELARGAWNGDMSGFPPDAQKVVRALASRPFAVLLAASEDDDDLRPVSRSLAAEGDDGEAVEEPPPISLRKRARTAVRGTVATLFDVPPRGCQFMLRLGDGRKVRCYPDAKYRDELSQHYARRTTLLVEGTYTRWVPEGGVPVMQRITEIVPLDDEPGSWRDAVGAAPRPLHRREGDVNLVIRGLRDA